MDPSPPGAEFPLLGALGRRFAVRRLRRRAQRAEERRARAAVRLDVPIPEALVLSLTTRCAEACSFCCAGARTRAVDLDEELAERLVAEAAALGTFTILLAGGEPLLRPDLVLRLVRDHPALLFLVFTGGRVLDAPLARRLRAPNLLVVTGADAERGGGRDARAALRGARVPFGYSIVVDRSNAEDVTSRPYVHDRQLEGCRAGIYIERLPVGRASARGYGLDGKTRLRVRSRLRALERDLGILLRFLPDGEEAFGGCLAGGRGVLHVSAAGRVEPCPFIRVAGASAEGRTLVNLLRSPFFAGIRRLAAEAPRPEGPCVLLGHPALDGTVGSDPPAIVHTQA